MVASTDKRVDFTARKKVLVIAYPEIAAAVYEALIPYIEPPDKAAPVSANGTGVEEYTVAWLCGNIFPSPLQRKKSVIGKVWQRIRDFTGARGFDGEMPFMNSIESTMSLFNWGEYDFVIIQDLWMLHSDPGRTLECAGYVLANLDYYLWGNFATKKIILITDHGYPALKAKWIHLSRNLNIDHEHFVNILSELDKKQAFETIDLNGEPEPGQRLLELIRGDDSPAVSAGHEQEHNSEILDRLIDPVMREAAKALQAYVTQQAEVLVVDDEFHELDMTYEQLTGKHLDPEQQDLETNRVYVASTANGTIEKAGSFKALVELCKEKFEKAATGDKRYTLLVTDILFKGPSWNQTGLDLIETLRMKSKATNRRTGIVAYTGFTTPFIAMSSYQRGADFVVAKLERSRHDPRIKSTQRLLMTLAFLCFQKSFLADKRKEAEELIDRTKSRKTATQSELILASLRQLQAVLPKYTVSLHLQQEWLDTCYLYEAINIYGPGSEQLKLVQKDIREKYD